MDAATGTIVQAGGTATIFDDGLGWAGSGSTQWVNVDFAAPAAGTAVRALAGDPDAQRQMAVARQLTAKKQRLQQ
jgi:hypothetical protein